MRTFQSPRLSLYLAIVTLAVAVSAVSASNGYALDDVALIADNARVHSLTTWWRIFATPYWPPQFGPSLYRPIATLGYAIQWAAGGGAPWVFHLVSIAMYATVSALVLALFLTVLSEETAFMAASLFAVHPVHVEAVGNVVGQCELLAALAMLGAALIYLRARRAGPPGAGTIAALAGLFAVACLSKEHALVLPALLVALEWLAVPNDDESVPPKPFRERVGPLLPTYIALGAVAIAALAIRAVVVGELLGERHLVPIFGIARVWVMLVVVPHWVRLLTWPAHLSAEYSPHQIAIPSGPGPEIVFGAVILIVIGGLFVALGRGGAESAADRAAARLGLAWAAITLLPVSNLFSVLLVAERTLFSPSIGAAMAVGALIAAAMRRAGRMAKPTVGRWTLAGAVAAVVMAGGLRSSDRQTVWRDDETLFAQTVIDAPLSYRAHFFHGQMLFGKGRRREAERELRLAIALNPTSSDVSPLNFLATMYREAGICAQALPLYRRAITGDPDRPDVRYGLASCLLSTGDLEAARRVTEDGLRRGELSALFRDLRYRERAAEKR